MHARRFRLFDTAAEAIAYGEGYLAGLDTAPDRVQPYREQMLHQIERAREQIQREADEARRAVANGALRI